MCLVFPLVVAFNVTANIYSDELVMQQHPAVVRPCSQYVTG